MREDASSKNVVLSIRDVELRYGNTLVQKDLTFDIHQGEIFVIMGGCGCGKSTLLKRMIGLFRPHSGSIWYGGTELWAADEPAQRVVCAQGIPPKRSLADQ